ncbi:flotillin-like FloA family protein [Oceanobacillus timonensis]|uniref:flotillin-like FloA family protein n=1 Tax=Oceanobacillus timonensis TaxID=1926285 RepID=UPI0009BB14E3
MSNDTIIPLVIIAVVIIVLAVFFTLVPVAIWISALASGVRINIFRLISMRLRRITPQRVVNPLIKAHLAGQDVTLQQLENHYLEGGNLSNVVNALIAADRADIDLSFERAAAMDLEGRDVLEVVRQKVHEV